MPILFTNRRLRVKPHSAVLITRKLEGPGTLTVSKNQEVRPEDILGRSVVNSGFTTINLNKQLGVKGKEALKFLKKPIGESVFKGEPIAYKKNLFGERLVVSPTDGKLDAYDESNGLLAIKYTNKETQLRANVYGIVDNVDPKNGEVLIKTYVTQVFGVLSTGTLRSGILRLINNNNDLINTNQILPDMIDQIILTGAFVFTQALKKAASVGVKGIISGGIDYADFKAITNLANPKAVSREDIGLSICITEGFGVTPIGEDIFIKIKPFDNKFIFLNGNNGVLSLPTEGADSIPQLRKIILPIQKNPNQTSPKLYEDQIKVGSSVRIIWPPFMGRQGKVLAIDQQPTTLESGIKTYLLLVETQNNKIKIAYENVELI